MNDFENGFKVGKMVCLSIIRSELEKCKQDEKDFEFIDNHSEARKRNLNYIEILQKIYEYVRCFKIE